MKMVSLEQTTLDICVNEAQQERLVITRNGKPVALIVGLEGIDEEQLQLGNSDKFWELITQRRQQKTVSRTELEKLIDEDKAEYTK
jgi:antitoxin (DNA-binding transcriptional repressor) of toxin-antitoxin stability system